MLNRKEILEKARKDFEGTWKLTKELLPKRHIDRRYPRIKMEYGKSHPVMDTIERLRECYLRMGFEEYINPLIVDEREIYKQFGPEALAVLDRCFYLAGLPRPDVGLGRDRIEEIEKLGVEITPEKVENLRKTLHKYKKGVIDGDDLVLEIGRALEVSSEMGLKVLEMVFPEFKELVPEPLSLTLRSHMTSGWFITISHLIGKKPLPFKLFSIDRCFRREQREDRSHLMTYHSASCVVVGEDVSIDDGMAVAEGLLSQFGFSKFRFKPDEKKSKYYVPDTQTEVYAYHPKLGEWLEVATFGIYSPIALSEYGIDVPVMNLGLGVERLAMILYNYEDVRKMVYPQLYDVVLSDRDIAYMLHIDKMPVTDELYNLGLDLIDICIKNRDKPAPCEVVLEREIEFYNIKKNIRITIYEREEGKRLLGPSVLNEIYVYDGNIIGVPESEEDIKEEYRKLVEDTRRYGISTGIRYIDALSFKVAYKIEEALVSNVDHLKIRVPIVRNLGDVNLKLEDVALKYIIGKGKVIDVRGPVFLNIEGDIG
ncbi:O-phosphoserine--tRNA ligase [Methanofervidicoccus sp. A16]|uniref:O-phosphoserine--tRNA ligase n=1 Tax=Methanofervidicoccus sp. A16 TaxID=2607662 RepID=UPI001187CE87|nr:O-phosphoserine--tRNA ligase [Methanofervidicoccus sp. A16]AXI25536.1 O-phosphoserine--tRNA ligase [Methanofervidicoccus sp. A16]